MARDFSPQNDSKAPEKTLVPSRGVSSRESESSQIPGFESLAMRAIVFCSDLLWGRRAPGRREILSGRGCQGLQLEGNRWRGQPSDRIVIRGDSEETTQSSSSSSKGCDARSPTISELKPPHACGGESLHRGGLLVSTLIDAVLAALVGATEIITWRFQSREKASFFSTSFMFMA